MAVSHIFFQHLTGQRSWRNFFNRTQCPDDANTVRHQIAENKICGCEQNRKSWSWHHWQCPGTAAVKWPLIMNLLLVQLYSRQRKSMMCFDHALYMATYFSQHIVPLQSGYTVQHVCLLHWTKAWILFGNNCRLIRSTIKTTGYETTRTVF